MPKIDKLLDKAIKARGRRNVRVLRHAKEYYGTDLSKAPIFFQIEVGKITSGLNQGGDNGRPPISPD